MLKYIAAAACSSILLATVDANAGCGFYAPPAETASAAAIVNDADQVSLVRDGTRFALTMSTNYKGPAEDFAMVVPVPVVLRQEQVKTLSPKVFEHLEKLTAPRIVEYDEEDPCRYADKEGGTGAKPGAVGAAPGGAKGGGGGGVQVEAQFIVGEYEIVVLSASESASLETWLHEHKYKIPEGASAALDPYVKQQQKFVVAKVDKTKVHRDAHGAVVLSPLRFVYETQDFRLPVRLGLLNAPKGGKQDLIIYTLAKGRMEAANLVNVSIPTNIDVKHDAIASFPAFYASLLDATLASAKGAATVLEYAWSANACGTPCLDLPLTQEEINKLGVDEVMPSATANELVLTRLHTRFDAETLKEDIVFRKVDNAENFQAKYAVRNPWEGEIDCKNPVRGNWIPSAPKVAVDLAAPPRDVKLASLVVTPIPSLGLKGSAAPEHKTAERVAIYVAIGAFVMIVLSTIATLVRRRRE